MSEPTGEEVAGFRLDIAAGGTTLWGAYPPRVTVQDGADCDLYLTADEARALAESLIRAADVIDAHCQHDNTSTLRTMSTGSRITECLDCGVQW